MEKERKYFQTEWFEWREPIDFFQDLVIREGLIDGKLRTRVEWVAPTKRWDILKKEEDES